MEDLDQALRLWQETARRLEPESPALPTILNNQGIALRTRSTLAALQAFERAVRFTPATSPDLPLRSGNLAACRCDYAKRSA